MAVEVGAKIAYLANHPVRKLWPILHQILILGALRRVRIRLAWVRVVALLSRRKFLLGLLQPPVRVERQAVGILLRTVPGESEIVFGIDGGRVWHRRPRFWLMTASEQKSAQHGQASRRVESKRPAHNSSLSGETS